MHTFSTLVPIAAFAVMSFGGAASAAAISSSSTTPCAAQRTKTVTVDLEARGSLPAISFPGGEQPTGIAIGAQKPEETEEVGAKDESRGKGKGKQGATTSAAAVQPSEAAATGLEKPIKNGVGNGGQGKGKQNQASSTTTSQAAETSAAENAEDDADDEETGGATSTSSGAAPSSTAATPIGKGNNQGKGKGKGNGNNNGQQTSTSASGSASETTSAAASSSSSASASASASASSTRAPNNANNSTAPASSSSASRNPQATGRPGAAIPNPTTPVPVSRAGGTLDPSAAAIAHQRDETATRAFTAVEIRAPNGQCMFVDPTAGDFRQNLIPVSLVDCSGSPNEQWDVITAGKHNQNAAGQNRILVVSSLMNGCLNFDPRRPAGDQVVIFSCGGRADGEGETTGSQQFEFIGAKSFAWSPVNAPGQCVLPDEAAGKLSAGPCPSTGAGLFSVFP